MAFFSFRADCPDHVEQFKAACNAAGIAPSLDQRPDDEFPDVEVELESSASLEALLDIMRLIVDGHVMLQTFRECRLKDNSLERDYELE